MNKRVAVNRVTFCFGDNGLPSNIILPEELGGVDLLRSSGQWDIRNENGEALTVFSGENTVAETIRKEDSTVVKFSALEIAGDKTLRMDLRHTLFDDGTVFSEVFFVGNNGSPAKLSRLELRFILALKDYTVVRYAMPFRPKHVDGKLIQTAAPERELQPGDDRIIDDAIFPQAGFSVCDKNSVAFYAEFFMEADGSAAGKNSDTASSVTWHDGDAVLAWDFQHKTDAPGHGPWQWRNTFGFVIAPAYRKRRFAPFAMYHYIDNFEHYPDDDTLQAIVDSQADVLIIHENWRSDVQNGGIAFDPVRMKKVVEFAHAHNIRVAPYIRGVEVSADDGQLAWYSEIFTPDYDGIYMDFGGPFGYLQSPTEFYPGGRICFRHQYNLYRSLRKVVGKNGFIFSHTGPMYSAIGMTGNLIDGYVSGEGERGLLLRSRFDHAYYSMAAVGPGTLWSAAFPEYGSQEIIPFLAATGQFPHVPLGTQFKSCSLVHPPAPGINEKPFLPLWKLWQLMKGEYDLAVFNDYNVAGIFPVQENISHYLMISGDEKAVCIYANFSSKPQRVSVGICWENTGFDPEGKGIYLCIDGKAQAFNGENFELPGLGVAAICVGEFDFQAYERVSPEMCRRTKEHLELVKEQQMYRSNPAKAENWFLRISVPDIPVAYENSMVWDLYDNRFVLNEVMPDGSLKKLGYIGKNGFQTRETAVDEFVVNAEASVWMNMKDVLGDVKGVKNLAIQSFHRGDKYYVNSPFYSFIQAELAEKPGTADYVVKFMNEVESDRSILHFSLDFA